MACVVMESVTTSSAVQKAPCQPRDSAVVPLPTANCDGGSMHQARNLVSSAAASANEAGTAHTQPGSSGLGRQPAQRLDVACAESATIADHTVSPTGPVRPHQMPSGDVAPGQDDGAGLTSPIHVTTDVDLPPEGKAVIRTCALAALGCVGFGADTSRARTARAPTPPLPAPASGGVPRAGAGDGGVGTAQRAAKGATHLARAWAQVPIDKLFEVETEKDDNHTFYSCRRCRVRLRARFRAALVNHLAACTSAPPKVLGLLDEAARRDFDAASKGPGRLPLPLRMFTVVGFRKARCNGCQRMVRGSSHALSLHLRSARCRAARGDDNDGGGAAAASVEQQPLAKRPRLGPPPAAASTPMPPQLPLAGAASSAPVMPSTPAASLSAMLPSPFVLGSAGAMQLGAVGAHGKVPSQNAHPAPTPTQFGWPDAKDAAHAGGIPSLHTMAWLQARSQAQLRAHAQWVWSFQQALRAQHPPPYPMRSDPPSSRGSE